MPTDTPALLPAGTNAADLAKQIELLRAGSFHFDRMPREATWRAALALVSAGLMRTWESGSHEAQYTALNFQITDLGRLALESVDNAD